ncbi:hypothetical protein GUITHDRAFT_109156 [Guillardia theta CCMP2712]|uniref:C3H1-type domain-containing protein n=1 Tax=Guillardia theta (strain CCMP2712) TaxID=905079 RepID=L1J9U5_GUITC|nr:hypothetical protein GUITHDRAFT_109156 [Guillardia theta CCMP2712]EKX45112.1 hypothetical protein GUITHDRAFT_109156 [Guillardia theta CCMP2712]|eukprot:XP_005832092.1 hypothetical protein GUITHDRAFT_109156 [Guillardia theta CCMP2712]
MGKRKPSKGSESKEAEGEQEGTATPGKKHKKQAARPAEPSPNPQAQGLEGNLHPFEHDPADDCETCFQAYCDIAPFLIKLAQRVGKPKKDLCIWDPYYCAGKVKDHLRKLGFHNVHNNNEDFYSLKPEQFPPYDVLLTSPPYSRNHIEKILVFASECKKPWILLMPQYVHRKSYYSAIIEGQHPFYMIPPKPYVYHAHHGGRKDNTNVTCRHWARDGKCPKGDECAFVHGEVGDSAQPAIQSKGITPVTPFKSIWHMHFPPEGMNNGIYTWAVHKLRKSKLKLCRHVEDIEL